MFHPIKVQMLSHRGTYRMKSITNHGPKVISSLQTSGCWNHSSTSTLEVYKGINTYSAGSAPYIHYLRCFHVGISTPGRVHFNVASLQRPGQFCKDRRAPELTSTNRHLSMRRWKDRSYNENENSFRTLKKHVFQRTILDLKTHCFFCIIYLVQITLSSRKIIKSSKKLANMQIV